MIVGIGIDIIELHRIQKSLERGSRLAERVLTEREKELFYSLEKMGRRVEFLAGRFAAKEAMAKALGKGVGRLSFQHMEIVNDQHGAPQAKIRGYEGYQIFLSISHSKEYAVAQAIITK
ncbi:holo-[acyl-carrier-protein] synthase [Compostibacillus humi]|uniref:Holo-[acyl-carrier-protein] synthase n=1 Tax=Compostibacillus humi TaxID=1245525 RepID=A0A8J2X930_9BACI|nr:holo-ACP synthase [Compostibacillus humi]GFZ78107.1 holo-[acyl-carrier-protein] synthase [Compostibacillus humi]HLT55537.1 holo-ACP synthase [Bacillota bacterium]